MTRVLILLCPIILATCAPWNQENAFISGLECGMTLEEIRQYVGRFEGTKLVQQNFADRASFVVTAPTNTFIDLWVVNERLRAAQTHWHDGRHTNIGSRPVVYLCGSGSE
jgi:hypothetical protein